MIHPIFMRCVECLDWLADVLHTTYETVNVWVFCVIWPVITIVLIILVIRKDDNGPTKFA